MASYLAAADIACATPRASPLDSGMNSGLPDCLYHVHQSAKFGTWTSGERMSMAGPPALQASITRAAGRRSDSHRGVLVVLAQPGVHEHRQRIFGFAGRGHMADVAAVVPRHEQFVGLDAGAEDLFQLPDALKPAASQRLRSSESECLCASGGNP